MLARKENLRPATLTSRFQPNLRNAEFDSVYDGIAALTAAGNRALAATESGKLRWYAAAIAGGAIVFVAVVLFQ